VVVNETLQTQTKITMNDLYDARLC